MRKGGYTVYKICHTEESSRRQRELELVLLEAMLRQPYERITLTELCQKAQIPRKTFYRYFPTKDAYDEGGYEARASRFKSGTAELIAKEAKALLEEMHSI